MAQWGLMAERLARASGFDTNAAILKQLQDPSLEELNKRFISILYQKYDIVAFREDEGMKGMRGLNSKVF